MFIKNNAISHGPFIAKQALKDIHFEMEKRTTHGLDKQKKLPRNEEHKLIRISCMCRNCLKRPWHFRLFGLVRKIEKLKKNFDDLN